MPSTPATHLTHTILQLNHGKTTHRIDIESKEAKSINLLLSIQD